MAPLSSSDVRLRLGAHRGVGRRQLVVRSQSPALGVTEEDTAGEPAADRLLSRVAAFGGVALLIGVVAKVLSVSRMDLTVAQVLATQSSPSGIVFGVLLLFYPVIPIVGISACLLLLQTAWLRGARVTFKRQSWGGVLYPAVACGAFLALGAYLTPRSYFLGGIALALGSLLIVLLIALGVMAVRAFRRGRTGAALPTSRPKRQPQARKATVAFTALYLSVSAFIALPVVLNDVAWLPPRQIELTSGTEFVGYEISRTDDTVTLLRDSDRKIVDVSLAAITSAKPCRLVNLVNTGAPLLPFSSQRFPVTPACP
jgi:hypothetical protein